MSSLIIINHVKEGAELAKEYKLPEPILEIMQQHHGTMLVSYFYQKAKEQGIHSLPNEEDTDIMVPNPRHGSLHWL